MEPKAGFQRRVQHFPRSTSWMARPTYGILFRWGERGYLKTGEKRAWPKMISRAALRFPCQAGETGAGSPVDGYFNNGFVNRTPSCQRGMRVLGVEDCKRAG